MNPKQLPLLIIAAAVLIGIGVVLTRTDNNASGNATVMAAPGTKLLPEFPLNDVQKITLSSVTESVNLVKDNEGWKVKEKFNFPAQYSNISELLVKLWELKITQQIPIGPSQLNRLSLDKPDSPLKMEGAGIQLELFNKDGKLITSLILGKDHNSDEAQGGYPLGRYVRLLDNDKVYLVKEQFEDAQPISTEWMSKQFFRADKVRTVTSFQPQKGYVAGGTNFLQPLWIMSRTNETSQFELVDGKTPVTVVKQEAQNVNRYLVGSTFKEVLDPSATNTVTGLALPARVIKAQTFDGMFYTVSIGTTNNSGSYYVTYTVDGDFKRVRPAVPGLTPEQDAEAQKSFDQQVEGEKGRVAQEKMQQRYIYEVPAVAVLNLLKSRTALLTPPPEAKKPGAPGIPGAAKPAAPGAAKPAAAADKAAKKK